MTTPDRLTVRFNTASQQHNGKIRARDIAHALVREGLQMTKSFTPPPDAEV
jgi:hypothetical protein